MLTVLRSLCQLVNINVIRKRKTKVFIIIIIGESQGVSPIVVIVMCHLVPTPESFEIMLVIKGTKRHLETQCGSIPDPDAPPATNVIYSLLCYTYQIELWSKF
jgi:hypothetical protein